MLKIEQYETEFAVEHMARKDHMRFKCQTCGDSYRIVSRWERFVHWVSCSAIRKIDLCLVKVMRLFGAAQKKHKQLTATGVVGETK